MKTAKKSKPEEVFVEIAMNGAIIAKKRITMSKRMLLSIIMRTKKR